MAHVEVTLKRQEIGSYDHTSRLVSLQQAVTAAANEAVSFEAALGKTLDAICSTFGWEAAHAFLIPEHELMLLPTNVWHLAKPELSGLTSVRAELADFNPATEKLSVRSLDSTPTPRAIVARELGLRCAVYLTVPVGPHPGAVLEFFAATQVELELDEGHALANIATQLGRVLERERFLSALLRSEAKFRGIFETNTVPMFFWHADQTILDANDALLRLLGYTRQEMERGEVRYREITPADQKSKDSESLEQIRRLGHCQPYEKNWIRRDGTLLNVILAGALLPGSTEVGTAVAVDVTELRRTAKSLEESERRYKLATSAAAISIWEMDMLSGLVFSDGVLSALLGYPPTERIAHKDWINRIHEADRERVLQHEQNALASTCRLPDGSTPVPEIEFRILDRRGRVRWFLNRGLLLHDAAGQPFRAIGAVTDITEQKRAQRALSTAQYQLHGTYARVRALTGRLINAQEEERRRVAREIHDDLGQRLATLGLSIERIKRSVNGPGELFAAAEKQVDELAKALREVSHNLHSAVLEHAGLEAALRSLVDEFRSTSQLDVRLILDPLPEGIPWQVSLAAYRIVQEALRNVHKHSGASSAKVFVNSTISALLVAVHDDGRGCNWNAARSKRGLGLIGARERARLVNGRMWIASSPGAGTRLSVVFPLKGKAQDNEAA